MSDAKHFGLRQTLEWMRLNKRSSIYMSGEAADRAQEWMERQRRPSWLWRIALIFVRSQFIKSPNRMQGGEFRAELKYVRDRVFVMRHWWIPAFHPNHRGTIMPIIHDEVGPMPTQEQCEELSRLLKKNIQS